MKNPALTILATVAGIGLIAGIALLSASTSGLFRTYEFNAFTGTGEWIGGVPLWAAITVLAVGVVAGVGALVVWGTTRASTSGRA